MRRHPWAIALVAGLGVGVLLAGRVPAQKQTDAELERVRVLYVAFFDALRVGDTEAIEELVDPPLYVFDGLEGNTIVYSLDELLDEVGDGANYQFEPGDLDIRLMGQVASVRAAMMFEAGDQFQPVFADVFAVLDDGRWRIKCAAIGPDPEADNEQ